jgi:lysophospholipid acyltransferase (LPLAT)-like uncharacterized protein
MSLYDSEWKLRLISFLACGLMHALGHTARFRVMGYERVQGMMKAGSGFILAIWHGRTLLPIHYCRGLGIWAITSLSRDGEIQTRTVSRFGYRIIRGSTGRGGIKAALAACKKIQKGGVLAITPDGPLGPANEVQEGTVFLARHTGCPIIPIGVGARFRKLMNIWDSYMIPMPFTRCALVFGEPIHLSESDNQPEKTIKDALDSVQQQAQAMVKEGC